MLVYFPPVSSLKIWEDAQLIMVGWAQFYLSGYRRMPVGGGDQGSQGDVQEHGLRQQRHDNRGRAPARAGQQGHQAQRGRSPAAHGRCKLGERSAMNPS